MRYLLILERVKHKGWGISRCNSVLLLYLKDSETLKRVAWGLDVGTRSDRTGIIRIFNSLFPYLFTFIVNLLYSFILVEILITCFFLFLIKFLIHYHIYHIKRNWSVLTKKKFIHSTHPPLEFIEATWITPIPSW